MTVNVFCINDNRLIIYACTPYEVNVIDVFEFSDSSINSRFKSQVELFKKSRNLILFDISSEDYHQEQLPHVLGRDRQLLIARKLSKYFPAGEYIYSECVERIKVGRRDDIYALSGVADSTSIEPIIGLISENNIDISGVYTLPLLVEILVQPVVHKNQVLVVSCEKERSERYTFRQTFLDNGHLYFSRQTSIIANDKGHIAAQFRKEIERTWQYLNNKRVLTANERMQVVFVPPLELAVLLKSEAGASHCDYLFVDPVELTLQHNCQSGPLTLEFSALGAFLLAKKKSIKPHYQPKKLHFYHKHQQLNRLLLWASIAVAAISVAVITSNFYMIRKMMIEGERLSHQSMESSYQLNSHRDKFDYKGTSPQQMQALVALFKNLSSPEILPDHVFSVVSESISQYNDLNISGLDWHMQSRTEDGALHSSTDMASSSYNNRRDDMIIQGVDDLSSFPVGRSPRAENVIVNIKGKVASFDGNYRTAIRRIESLSAHLRAQDDVQAAVVTKLPLDIDPGIKASRSLSSEVIPDFGIEVTFNVGL